ncbi:TIGR04104 family putative zinc finger protein [Halalkalibacillus sediminis]|nr:TIGR04104 family putative zinc finger protein [Halalkalibacillus sediminis]
MGLPTCDSCGHQWSWKNAFKMNFRFGGGTRCNNCGEKQYMTTKSFWKTWMILLPIFLIVPTFIAIEIAAFVVILLAIGILCATPYFLELSSEEKPMW